jgi:dihydrofolate reductase
VPAGASARRPRCSVFIAVSVDGYIAREDGAIDWLAAVQQPAEDYGYQQFFDSVDALVVGRKTYDFARELEPWPYAGKRCIVFTHRPVASRNSEEHFAGSPESLVEQLGRDGVRRVYVDGGKVIQQFLAAKLIDDLTVSVVPVVLGGGIRLFGSDGPEQRLTLAEARSWPTGLAQLCYRVG